MNAVHVSLNDDAFHSSLQHSTIPAKLETFVASTPAGLRD